VCGKSNKNKSVEFIMAGKVYISIFFMVLVVMAAYLLRPYDKSEHWDIHVDEKALAGKQAYFKEAEGGFSEHASSGHAPFTGRFF
jgi:hypothetical protein